MCSNSEMAAGSVRARGTLNDKLIKTWAVRYLKLNPVVWGCRSVAFSLLAVPSVLPLMEA